MASYEYERLSALDTTFLDVEDENAHMHVGAVSLFDAGPMRGADGAIDIERIRRLVEAGFRHVPRYRQRLARVPLFDHPVWVDDDRFNLNYHVRHTCLPQPGDERMLKRLAGRILSQQLDRGKPLWELWIVEGIEGDRVAMITKAHHCMIDGVGSVELTGVLLRTEADPGNGLCEPQPWVPRPKPSGAELLLGEVGHRLSEPLSLLGDAGALVRHPWRTVARARDVVAGIGEAVSAGLRPASATPLNLEIGPHRRFDWTDMELGELKAVKDALGGTVNDVVLATVSGALGKFLHARGLKPGDLDFRAMIPVNVRASADREALGNRISMLVARLPIDQRDPKKRLSAVIAATRELKGSRQAQGIETLEEISDWTLTTLFSAFARLTARSRPYNIVVTNVPGPQFKVYMLGSPMRAVYPLVPLNRNQALGIAVFSYDSRLYWGFNADWDAIPDLHAFVDAIVSSFSELRRAAEATTTSTSTRRRRADAASTRASG